MQGERVLHRMSSKLCKQINIKKHHKEIARDYTFVTFDNFDRNNVKDDIDTDKNDRQLEGSMKTDAESEYSSDMLIDFPVLEKQNINV